MNIKNKSNKQNGIDLVLTIQCGDNHLAQLQTDANNNPTGPIQNGILDTVRNELNMDQYHISQSKTIFVRINEATLDNSVLNEW